MFYYTRPGISIFFSPLSDVSRKKHRTPRFRVMQRCTLHSAASADFTWRMSGRFIDTHTTHRGRSDSCKKSAASSTRRRAPGAVVPREPDIGTGPRARWIKTESIRIHFAELWIRNIFSTLHPSTSCLLSLPPPPPRNRLSILIPLTEVTRNETKIDLSVFTSDVQPLSNFTCFFFLY